MYIGKSGLNDGYAEKKLSVEFMKSMPVSVYCVLYSRVK